jgi:hypothetical protein
MRKTKMALSKKDNDSLKTILEVITHVDYRIEKLTDKYDRLYEDLKKDIQHLHTEFDRIGAIRVNGTIGFEEILKKLWETTETLRIDTSFEKQIKNYSQNHLLLRFLFYTKIGKIIGSISIVYIFISVLHTFGVPVEPTELIVKLIKFIGNLIP